MPRGLERFLKHRTAPARRASLGRVFSVTRETWRLSDDPKTTAPKVQILATRRSASDAADIAREAAAAFRRHGFHKPSRAWWAADATHFHRYLVHAGRQRPALAWLLVSGAAAVAAAALARRRRAAGD